MFGANFHLAIPGTFDVSFVTDQFFCPDVAVSGMCDFDNVNFSRSHDTAVRIILEPEIKPAKIGDVKVAVAVVRYNRSIGHGNFDPDIGVFDVLPIVSVHFK